LARVSRVGYYRLWQASAPRQHDTAVRDAIQRLVLANGRYRRGYRYITRQLRPDGLTVNHKRVLHLMREGNLLGLRRRPFVPLTTDTRHRWPVVPNLARDMHLSALDQLWVADITYIRLQEEFAYLAVVLDAFSRRVIGWTMADHLGASLAVMALTMALAARLPPWGSLVHHSDRGVQYAGAEYAGLLQAHGIAASMSRVGNPYDNDQSRALHQNPQG
jgi:putative transposase